VMCGKHTIVRLQISLQVSKQWYQSGSRNTATVYYRLLNERTLRMVALPGATQDPAHCPREQKKNSDAGCQACPKSSSSPDKQEVREGWVEEFSVSKNSTGVPGKHGKGRHNVSVPGTTQIRYRQRDYSKCMQPDHCVLTICKAISLPCVCSTASPCLQTK
jgi:hypothetical protein